MVITQHVGNGTCTLDILCGSEDSPECVYLIPVGGNVTIPGTIICDDGV